MATIFVVSRENRSATAQSERAGHHGAAAESGVTPNRTATTPRQRMAVADVTIVEKEPGCRSHDRGL